MLEDKPGVMHWFRFAKILILDLQRGSLYEAILELNKNYIVITKGVSLLKLMLVT